ncbi:MAG: hypothetical protein WA208_01505 [Thermoanaerobaculia bacterium]
MATPRNAFLGRWRITSIAGWDKSDIDLLGPAYIEFVPRNDGDFQFSAVTGQIDYRVSSEADGPIIEWAWVGDDDGSETSGRGWAVREGETLVGTIFMFGGDDFRFEASAAKPRRTSRGG